MRYTNPSAVLMGYRNPGVRAAVTVNYENGSEEDTLRMALSFSEDKITDMMFVAPSMDFLSRTVSTAGLVLGEVTNGKELGEVGLDCICYEFSFPAKKMTETLAAKLIANIGAYLANTIAMNACFTDNMRVCYPGPRPVK